MGVGVVGGGWIGVGVVGGLPPTHVHMHAHTHAHTHVVNMIISCKWPPLLGNPWEFPMMSYACAHTCMCVHAHVCAHVWGAPSYHPPPTSTHPPYTPGGTPRISQNSIALELIEIFQFRLKI